MVHARQFNARADWHDINQHRVAMCPESPACCVVALQRVCASVYGVQVMAGQGTVAWELLEQAQDGIDAIIVPVGGGGLIGGIAAVMKAWRPDVQVSGAKQRLPVSTSQPMWCHQQC
jgi:hypothetical protein